MSYDQQLHEIRFMKLLVFFRLFSKIESMLNICIRLICINLSTKNSISIEKQQ